MSGREEEAEAPRALMDLGLDLDLGPSSSSSLSPSVAAVAGAAEGGAADDAEWPFDALVSPFLLPPSPPQSLLQLPFASPPSPLWLFEDRPFDTSTSISDQLALQIVADKELREQEQFDVSAAVGIRNEILRLERR